MGRKPDFNNRLRDVKDQKDYSRTRGNGMNAVLAGLAVALAIGGTLLVKPILERTQNTVDKPDAQALETTPRPAAPILVKRIGDLVITSTRMNDGSFQGELHHEKMEKDKRNLIGTYNRAKNGTLEIKLDGTIHVLSANGKYKENKGKPLIITTDRTDAIGFGQKINAALSL